MSNSSFYDSSCNSVLSSNPSSIDSSDATSSNSIPERYNQAASVFTELFDRDNPLSVLDQATIDLLTQVSQSTRPDVREKRFTFDATLALTGQVIQCLDVFRDICTHYNQHEGSDWADEIINQILNDLDFSQFFSDVTLENIDQKTTELKALLAQLVKRIEQVLACPNNNDSNADSDAKETAGMTMADFFSLGQMALRARHRQAIAELTALDNPESIKTEPQNNLAKAALFNIATALRNSGTIEDRIESGKPGMAEGLYNPLQNQYVVTSYKLNNQHFVEITETTRCWPDDIEDNLVLTDEIMTDYHHIANYCEIDYPNLAVKSDNKMPFWFNKLAPLVRFNMACDLKVIKEKAGDFAKNYINSEIDTEVLYKQKFKLLFAQKYGFKSAKGRALLGISGRTKSKVLLKQQPDGSYQQYRRQQPPKHHFTSAGAPVHIRAHDNDEHINYAAKQIASVIPMVIERQQQWMEHVFGEFTQQEKDRGENVITSYLLIHSLLSPIQHQGKGADTLISLAKQEVSKVFKFWCWMILPLFNMISKNSAVIEENNEENILIVIGKAIKLLRNAMSQRQLHEFNSRLAVDHPFVVLDYNVSSINDLALDSWLASEKVKYATGAATAVKSLSAHYIAINNHWYKYCCKWLPDAIRSNSSTYIDFKNSILTVQEILTELDTSLSVSGIPIYKINALEHAYKALCQHLQQHQAFKEHPSLGITPIAQLALRTQALLLYSKVQHDPKHKALASVLSELINPDSILAACKSHHDRAEHKVALLEAMQLYADAFGEYPDILNDKEARDILLYICYQKKYRSGSIMADRYISASNFGTKSHPSWSEFLNYFAEVANLDKIVITKETIIAWNKKFDAMGNLGDFKLPKQEQPISSETIKEESRVNMTQDSITSPLLNDNTHDLEKSSSVTNKPLESIYTFIKDKLGVIQDKPSDIEQSANNDAWVNYDDVDQSIFNPCVSSNFGDLYKDSHSKNSGAIKALSAISTYEKSSIYDVIESAYIPFILSSAATIFWCLVPSLNHGVTVPKILAFIFAPSIFYSWHKIIKLIMHLENYYAAKTVINNNARTGLTSDNPNTSLCLNQTNIPEFLFAILNESKTFSDQLAKKYFNGQLKNTCRDSLIRKINYYVIPAFLAASVPYATWQFMYLFPDTALTEFFFVLAGAAYTCYKLSQFYANDQLNSIFIRHALVPLFGSGALYAVFLLIVTQLQSLFGCHSDKTFANALLLTGGFILNFFTRRSSTINKVEEHLNAQQYGYADKFISENTAPNDNDNDIESGPNLLSNKVKTSLFYFDSTNFDHSTIPRTIVFDF